MSKNESKTVNNRELIEVDSNSEVFSVDVALNIYSFLPVTEVLRVLSCVSKLFNKHCQIFRFNLAQELLTQQSRSTQSQIPLQSMLADAEFPENCKTADKICFRFNFVYLGAVLAPVGIQYVAPKGSPWHDTLMGIYSAGVTLALGVVTLRCLSLYCKDKNRRRKNYLEKQIKNLTKLSVILERKNQENKVINEESRQRHLGAELPYVYDEEKLNTPSCQLHLKSS
jgi:hypothetical protein